MCMLANWNPQPEAPGGAAPQSGKRPTLQVVVGYLKV